MCLLAANSEMRAWSLRNPENRRSDWTSIESFSTARNFAFRNASELILVSFWSSFIWLQIETRFNFSKWPATEPELFERFSDVGKSRGSPKRLLRYVSDEQE